MALNIVSHHIRHSDSDGAIGIAQETFVFKISGDKKMLRETVTVSCGEGNSAVNAAWEYGDFDRKQVTDNACSNFCFNNVSHTLWW